MGLPPYFPQHLLHSFICITRGYKPGLLISYSQRLQTGITQSTKAFSTNTRSISKQCFGFSTDRLYDMGYKVLHMYDFNFFLSSAKGKVELGYLYSWGNCILFPYLIFFFHVVIPLPDQRRQTLVSSYCFQPSVIWSKMRAITRLNE